MTFASAYRDRSVLVTGHTGFKGSWLTTWLLKLGARVTGLSIDVPTRPAMFDKLELSTRIEDIRADVRNLDAVRQVVIDARPEFVFHLAAQAIVSASYTDPVTTIMTNVAGTMNVLESLRELQQPCVAVLITSDKCYDNVEWVWGYRETDRLGGADVYSGSKGAAELVIKAYCRSFFRAADPVRVAVARAGNVVGGGDWAPDRIIPDCMRAWSASRCVEVRSPQATRPWQHALEPLSGYLTLGQQLNQQLELHGEAFNFGPTREQSRTVLELLEALAQFWNFPSPDRAYKIAENPAFHEASLLRLNCDKALALLRWEPTLDFGETMQLVGQWYSAFYRHHADMYALTLEQIAAYERSAIERGRVWARV